MKLYITNKFFSLSGKSLIKNESGELVYLVKGNIFSNTVSKTYKKTVIDTKKNKLFIVKNKIFHELFHETCCIYNSENVKLAELSESHLIKEGYEVIGATQPISIEGKWGDFTISMSGKRIGRMYDPSKENFKEFFRLSDAFVLEIDDPEDAPFMCAMVIAIDNIRDTKRRKN